MAGECVVVTLYEAHISSEKLVVEIKLQKSIPSENAAEFSPEAKHLTQSVYYETTSRSPADSIRKREIGPSIFSEKTIFGICLTNRRKEKILVLVL